MAERVDSTGNVPSTDSYDAFGKKLAGNPSGDPYGFGGQAGYYTDAETGLVLCTHRFYDPGTGRFLTRDPLGYGGGINLYSYTQNNPGNGMDPSGHGVMVAIAAAGGARLINTLRLASVLTGTLQDVQSARPNPTEISEQAERMVEDTPDAAPHDKLLEGADSEEVASKIEVDQAAREGWSSLPESSGEAVSDGVGTAAEELGGGATVGEAGTLSLGPIAVIAAGVLAVADLGNYIVTGKSVGPFTRFGSWLGDQLFPGPDGLPASVSLKSKKCQR